MNDLFDILKKYNVQLTNGIPDHMRCAICKRLVVDSCFAPCGCKFCWNCIQKYLSTGDRKCPSNKEQCQEYLLNFSRDITKDPSRDVDMLYLTAECPLKNCRFHCQLRKLAEHMRACSKIPTTCVYYPVGCTESEVATDSMRSHFDESSVEHGKLIVNGMKRMEMRVDEFDSQLTSFIGEKDELRSIMMNIRKEIEALKTNQESQRWSEIKIMEDNVRILDENRKLKDDLIKCQNEVTWMQQKIIDSESRQLDVEFQLKMLKEFVEQKHQEQLKIYENIQEEMRQVNETIEKINFGIDLQLAKHQEHQVRITEVEQQLHQKLEDVLGKWKKLKTDSKKVTEDHKSEIEEVRQKLQFMEHLQTYRPSFGDSTATDLSDLNEFTWKIENIDSKYQNNISEYSRPFYSDGAKGGYKVCLCYHMSRYLLVPNSLWLTFHLIRGNNDGFLRWPMERVLKLDIIDQYTGQSALSIQVCRATVGERSISENRKAAYERPINDANNYSDGFVYFKTYDELKLIPGIIKNDSILVKCRLLP